ncbi:MAG: response regulator [Phycisphaerales bacterium JB040]
MGTPQPHKRGNDEDRPNTLGLRDSDLTRLLGEFERASGRSARGSIDREFSRWPFPSTSVPVTLLRPGVEAEELRLACRNLSRGGVGLLHAAPLEPGTRLAVCLPRRTGGEVVVEGTVARCTHREGVIHEIGVRFDSPIAVRDFIRPDLFEGWLSYERIDPEQVAGTMLHVEPEAMDRRMMGHFLRDTGVLVDTFTTGREALAHASAAPDLIVFDHAVPDMSGTEFVTGLRRLGVATPVILTARDATPQDRAEIRFSGANAYLAKPFEESGVLLALAEFLVEPPSSQATAGCLQSTPGPQLAGAYASKLRSYADELDALVDAGRQIDAYVICVQIKGTAPTLGFRAIGDQAGWLANKIASGVKLPQIRTQVSELTEACRRLRAA